MKPTTLRLQETTLEALDEEATEYGFANRTEYIRHILDNRGVVVENTGETTQANTPERDELRDRVDELEKRLDRLEGEIETEPEGSVANEPAESEATLSYDAQESEREAGADDTIDAALEYWEPGRNQEEREPRREIGRIALEWLRDHPREPSKSDFVAALYEETAPDGQGVAAWWESVVRDALQHAAERGYVDASGRSYEWLGGGEEAGQNVYDPAAEFE